MKFLYSTTADIIWLVHLGVIVLVLFGWLMPSLWTVYMALLIAVLVSLLALPYCILSKWEFDLRTKINPEINYNYAYTTYYTYKLTSQYLSPRFIANVGIVFVSLSLAINIYFAFLY